MTTTDYRERIPIAAPQMGERERDAVVDVLESGQLASGEQVAKFESEFAAFCRGTHGIATSNGTTALHATLEAVGIGEGDTVVTTPFTFIATANAIKLAGADVLFVDIDPETYNIDPERVESRIDTYDGSVDAILAVHLYGLPADMMRLRDVADRHGMALIEDAAQAHGATHRGEPVGAIGDAGCFSFYPTKNMTTGEGGMIVTDDDEIARRARQFINHGRTATYEHERVGHNFRMTDIAAAIGREQLDRLPTYTDARRKNARQLTDGLADNDVTTPAEPDGDTHVYHQYTIRSDTRDKLRDFLDEFGIDSGVYYPTPVHEQPAYHDYDVSLPEAERAAAEVLSLPVHPQLSSTEVDLILTAIEYFESYH